MRNQPKTGKRNEMGVRPIGKPLLTMAIPLMLSILARSPHNIAGGVVAARSSSEPRVQSSISRIFPVTTGASLAWSERE